MASGNNAGAVVTDLWTALAMVLVVEGLFYALFPEEMIRFMRQIMDMSPTHLRRAGVMAMSIGVVLVWIIRNGNMPVPG